MLHHTAEVIKKIINTYLARPDVEKKIIVKPTAKDCPGDLSLVLFPLAKALGREAVALGHELTNVLLPQLPHAREINFLQGYLNITFGDHFWLETFSQRFATLKHLSFEPTSQTILIEFSSPNTNKPLHLGHIRNNVLGAAMANIYEALGNKVIRVNLVNDRGIHICKSMLAWQKYSNGQTPESSAIKGDHLVGNYYVLFEQKNKELVQEGGDAQSTPLMLEARDMLRAWENHDPKTLELWSKLNSWVYAGFEETYARLGIRFDKTYYESQTYLLGKEVVMDGLAKKVFYAKEDNSVWVDLSSDGLDEKVLLRADGTSVYLTQDLGTAELKHQDFKPHKSIYVVGSEQDYHFKVLFLVLAKLKKTYAATLYHLSYGMVDLPSGRMKSREGTVVDADELIDQMTDTARRYYVAAGSKLSNFAEQEREQLSEQIALGALKYYLLKVEARKRITFNPEEAIDLHGNTGPFIQYTVARINSLLQKSGVRNLTYEEDFGLRESERSLIKTLGLYREILRQCAKENNPSFFAAYLYNLAKRYNQFYHEEAILSNQYLTQKNIFQLEISKVVRDTLKAGLKILGIHAPDKM